MENNKKRPSRRGKKNFIVSNLESDCGGDWKSSKLCNSTSSKTLLQKRDKIWKESFDHSFTFEQFITYIDHKS